MNKLTKKILITNLKAQIEGKDVLPQCIIGTRGTGKTSGIKAIANQLDAAILNVSIPTKDITYFTGIPDFIDGTNMGKYSESGTHSAKGTNWSAPELIVQANRLAEKHGSCIVLLDDFHKLTGGIQEAMYEFLLEKKLADYKLHPQVAIVCAMNFSKESGAGQMEEPIKDRLSLLHVEFDFDYWYDNFGKFLHHYISSFLKANQHLVLEDETIDLNSNASPRSWSQLSNDFELYDSNFIQENVVYLAKQKVTGATATELAKHIAYMEAIDFTSVVARQEIKNIADIPVLDRLIWAYIINYIHTPADAAYIIKLINYNEDEPNFIGYIAAELYTKYLAYDAGKPVSVANQIVISKLLGTYNSDDYKLTEKQTELLAATNFNNSSKLLEIASVYVS